MPEKDVEGLSWLLTIVGGILATIIAAWQALLLWIIKSMSKRVDRMENGVGGMIEDFVRVPTCNIVRESFSEKLEEIKKSMERMSTDNKDGMARIENGQKILHGRLDAFIRITCKHCAEKTVNGTS